MDPEAISQCNIVIVDDDPQLTRLLRRILERSGYGRISSSNEPADAVSLVSELEPDLLLLDLCMPGVSGFEILERLAPVILDGGQLPVVVLSGEMDRTARYRALELGARDYISKPFDAPEVVLRVRNLLTTRLLQRQLSDENRQLEGQLALGSHRLARTRLEAVRHLALAAECRDYETHGHTERVGLCAAALAGALGCDSQLIELIGAAARLHDVGKIGIPDRILLKAGRLSPAEFLVMQRHTTLGAEILSGSTIPELQIAQAIALSHHERWDGQGYPHGRCGEEIPLVGRIVAVADVFDALVHRRPYKPAWSVREAVREIGAQAGRQFDPRVVEAFLALDHTRLAWTTDESLSVS